MDAALFGQLQVSKWARENGLEFGMLTCISAASGGQLEVLQWLHANDCPWDELACYAAASRGHLEVLKWATTAASGTGRDVLREQSSMGIWRWQSGCARMQNDTENLPDKSQVQTFASVSQSDREVLQKKTRL
jgi:hypothetical protein